MGLAARFSLRIRVVGVAKAPCCRRGALLPPRRPSAAFRRPRGPRSRRGCIAAFVPPRRGRGCAAASTPRPRGSPAGSAARGRNFRCVCSVAAALTQRASADPPGAPGQRYGWLDGLWQVFQIAGFPRTPGLANESRFLRRTACVSRRKPTADDRHGARPPAVRMPTFACVRETVSGRRTVSGRARASKRTPVVARDRRDAVTPPGRLWARQAPRRLMLLSSLFAAAPCAAKKTVQARRFSAFRRGRGLDWSEP